MTRWQLLSRLPAIRLPLVLVLPGIVVVVLGTWGYTSAPVGDGIPDALYKALKLFTGGHEPSGTTVWQLQIARWGALITSAAALLGAIWVLTRDQIDDAKVRRSHGHVVICGLSEKGLRFASHLKQSEPQTGVVIVDDQADHPLESAARATKALLVHGDARKHEVLRHAQVQHAKQIVVVCGDDQLNAAIALNAQTVWVENEGAGELRCLTHISDAELCTMLRVEEAVSGSTGGFQLDFFNVSESAARALVEASGRDTPRNIAIAGATPIGLNLILLLARRSLGLSPLPLRAIVVDEHATRAVGRLRDAHPKLLANVDLAPVDLSAEELALSPHRMLDAAPSWSEDSVFVVYSSDSDTLAAANGIARITPDETPIVVALSTTDGLAKLLKTSDRADFRTVGLLDITCTSELALFGSFGLIARANHEAYRRAELARGVTVADNPSLSEWDDLPQHLKDDNLDVARDIRNKLSRIGCSMIPIGGAGSDPFFFSTDEIERLAMLEHERWLRRKGGVDGYQYGATKDLTNRTHQDLVPWDHLTDEAKEKDRQQVTEIPRLLLQAGYQIIRLGPQSS